MCFKNIFVYLQNTNKNQEYHGLMPAWAKTLVKAHLNQQDGSGGLHP
jgi:hypothetical protein